MHSPSFNIDKWSVLGGLRFVLASIVAITHLGEFSDLGFFSFMTDLGAFEAILGFLLISGYSVTLSYIQEPKNFLLRRLQRLYPIYLASILLTLGVSVFVSHHAPPSMGTLLINGLFLNQILTDHSYVAPAWSLSLEFWLYCLGPLLMMLGSRWNRWIIYGSFAAYLAYTFCRSLLHLPYFAGVGYGGNILLLAFMWVCGLRLAREQHSPGEVMWDIRLIFTLHLGFAALIQLVSRVRHHSVALFFSKDLMPFALQALTLCAVYYVFKKSVLTSGLGKKKSSWLRALGDLSYPLYLVHFPVYIVLKTLTPLRNAGAFYLLAISFSYLVYLAVDFYSRKRRAEGSAVPA